MQALTTPREIEMFHLLQLRAALRLELTGLRHSRGSAYAYVKRNYGLRGNRQSVYTQFCELIEQEKHK